MKTIQEMITVMQACADGKMIEIWNRNTKRWEDCDNPLWDWAYDYRIKPVGTKIEYEPYENAEEFFHAQKEHGKYIKDKKETYSPFVNSYNHIALVCHEISTTILRFDALLTYGYAWQDGTPCGKPKQTS